MAENTIKINVEVDDRPVKSLKAELRETIQQLQQAEIGTEAFDKLNQKAAALKDRMAEVNEQVAVFATGSKYEQVSNSLGEIGAGLRDMDFDRVTNGAKLFAQTSKSITFKDAIGSLKQMGSAFVSIGKTILTNPLFLIVAVVGAIIAAVIALLDELGILQDIFNAVGKAIGWVIQQLKDFLDWIGLTDYAAEESARKQAAVQEKVAASYEAKRNKVVDSYDHEIKLAGIAGESVVEMERQKQYAIIETSKKQIEALRVQMEQLKAAGDLTKEKADEIRKAITDLKTGIHEAKQEVQVINATEVADNKKKNETQAADNKAAAKAASDRRKQEAADRLAASRMIQDAGLTLMKEGIDREISENQIKYQRLIEDTKANERLLAAEKLALVTSLQEQEFEARKAIELQYLADMDAATEASRLAREEKKASETQAYMDAADAMAAKTQELNAKEVAQAEEKAATKAKIEQQYRDSVVALAETIFTISNSLGKQDEKSKEQRAKRQFNVQKAMNLAMAVVDGYKSITSSLAQAPIAIGPIPSPAGIASLAFAIATTASSIAKIASTKYNGGSSGGGGGASMGGAAMPSMGGIQQASQTPQMNLNNSAEQTAQSSSKREKVIVVDYHDIQDKGNELQMMNNKVTLA